MSIAKYVSQVRRRSTQYETPLTKIQSLMESREVLIERVDTTLNASITELFPALAFNNRFRPSSVEDFKKFLYTLNLNGKIKRFFR